MATAPGVIIIRIATIIIKLINKPDRKRAHYPYRERRKKISSRDLVRYKWPDKISHRVNEHQQKWGNYKIACFQWLRNSCFMARDTKLMILVEGTHYHKW